METKRPGVEIPYTGYESPIKMILDEVRWQINADVLKAVQDVKIEVDRDELIRALQYDRTQYERGYALGYVQAIADRPDIVRCRECKNGGHCTMESQFILIGKEDPFCCAGERKSNKPCQR